MKSITKVISLILVVIVTFSTICSAKISTVTNPNPNLNNKNVINVAVLIYSFEGIFVSQLKQSFEAIENENKDKVNFTFYDGKNNIAIQYETLDSLIKSNIDLFIVNLADSSENAVESFVSKAKQKSIPIVLVEVDPQVASKVSKYYEKVAFVSTNSKLAGMNEVKFLLICGVQIGKL